MRVKLFRGQRAREADAAVDPRHEVVVGGVVAGLLSWLVGDLAGWTSLQKIAIASVVAFTVSETIEAVVFTPIRRRNLTAGVALSATVGNAIDSLIFLTLAFSSLAFFWGQFWGKTEAIAIGVALTFARRRLVPVPAYSQ